MKKKEKYTEKKKKNATIISWSGSPHRHRRRRLVDSRVGSILHGIILFFRLFI